ncbi:MAG: L-seryl-tRNA(Sec) selenium transferase [Aggregatilineales bacterium]
MSGVLTTTSLLSANEAYPNNNEMTGHPHYRPLPSVDALLRDVPDLSAAYGHGRTVEAIRRALIEAREILKSGNGAPSHAELLSRVRTSIRIESAPRRVINATGVIIHTNLGRATLSDAAQQAVFDAASGYSALEYDLESGGRGKRETHVEALLTMLTGAEAATVVNNNAAAMLLTLTALAQSRAVIVSRGQLVEIGGGFRVPDVLVQSGARLIEVGTTNRTRIADFERAITPDTAALLRVHSSNFKQIGFVEQPTLAELAAVAHSHGLLAIDDLGSGALLDTAPFGLEHEPTPGESLTADFDVVTLSGDKLLGGPQAGIIVGKRESIEAIKRHPLARAVRIDKLDLAALIATLDHYRYGEALTHIPVWRMIALSPETIRARAEAWAAHIGAQASVIPVRSTIGGGSLPGETLPSYALALKVPTIETFMARLRLSTPPVIGRIANDRALFDPRTVFESQDTALIAAIEEAETVN